MMKDYYSINFAYTHSFWEIASKDEIYDICKTRQIETILHKLFNRISQTFEGNEFISLRRIELTATLYVRFIHPLGMIFKVVFT
jgi:hypothetical protein